MAVYLGSSKKLKINLGNDAYVLNLYSVLPSVTETILSSLDDYILKDSNGLYLIPKEEE